MLNTIFFDLGNVLVFFSHEKMVEQVASCTGLAKDAIWKILIEEKVQENYEAGKISTPEVVQMFQKRALQPFSTAVFLKAASDIFTPNLPIYPIIKDLKGQGIRLVLLSNTSECHFHHVSSHYPILKLFDDYVLSFEVGALKPSETIFLKALSLANCPPKNCFYTDDIPEFIAGAKKVGLDSALFTGVESLKKSLLLRGLSFA